MRVVCMAMNTNTDDFASKLILQGVHIELTPAMQNIIRDKFAVLLRHNEWIVRINIRLNKTQAKGKQAHFAAVGHIEIGGPDLVAHVEGPEAYDVLDGLVEKLDKLLRDRHERRKDKRNHPNDVEIESSLPKVSASEAL